MPRFVAACCLMLSIAVAHGAGAPDRGDGTRTLPSRYSVQDTIDRVEGAAKAIGAAIFNRIDFQAMSRKMDVDIRPNQLVVFGRGRGGPVLLKEDPTAALDLPFKALAWEDADGRTWVRYTTGTFIDRRYAVRGAASAVKNIDETIDALIAEALR